MKTRMILTGVILMSVLLLSGCGGAPAKDLKTFHFSFSTGNAMNASVSYDLKYEDGVYTASVKPSGVPEEEASVRTVDEAFVQELEKFLQEYHTERWNGFHKSNKHVLDGNSFSFFYRTKDGKGCEASGYMKWPKNYSEVKNGIGSISGKLLQE